MFKPLTKTNIRSIIDLLVKDVNRRLEEKELQIELTEAAKDFVVEGGYDPMYGARPLKRYLQKNVETLAARLILAGNVGRGDSRKRAKKKEMKSPPWYGTIKVLYHGDF